MLYFPKYPLPSLLVGLGIKLNLFLAPGPLPIQLEFLAALNSKADQIIH